MIPLVIELSEILKRVTVKLNELPVKKNLKIELTPDMVINSQVNDIINVISRECITTKLDTINDFIAFCQEKDLTFSKELTIGKLSESPGKTLIRMGELYKLETMRSLDGKHF